MTDHANEFSDYIRQARDLINRGSVTGVSDQEFNQLALRLFDLQFSTNAPYHKLCESRGVNVDSIQRWQDIPAMPTAAFKEWEVTSLLPENRSTVFHSSGTTEQRPSRHWHSAESLKLYDDSAMAWFRENMLNSPDNKPTIISLTPSGESVPNSSLAHMCGSAIREYGDDQSTFVGCVSTSSTWEIDHEIASDKFRKIKQQAKPILLLGTAFNFVHLLDQIESRQSSFNLPQGTRVMETGGYKGRSRSLPKDELHALITRKLGVAKEHIICEYGMSELSSQAYDSPTPENGERIFRFPPWARTMIISPETGEEVAHGETGLLRIFDLANARSVLAIQTEDLAVRHDAGFTLIGRAALAEPRGCSRMTA